MNKMMPMDYLQLVAFFEQCQTANKVAGVLDKLKEKKQPKEKKKAHLCVTCSWTQTTSSSQQPQLTSKLLMQLQ
jgi:hypothetical protein